MLDYFATDIGKRHICLLYGLGGSGKTQIALKFLAEVKSTRYSPALRLNCLLTQL
jgi:Cdc6-like AAA superfamily ATPase